MGERVHFKLLTADDVSNIYDKCVEFVSSKGIRIIKHQDALKMLDKAGAQVDFDSGQVRFPKDIIEEALRTVPRSFTLAAMNGRDLPLPHPDGMFYVRSVTDVRHYIDPDSNAYRDPTPADAAEWAQLLEVLDEVDICPFIASKDVPDKTADIHALKGFLENTGKHITVQPFSFKSIEYLIQLGQVAVGGTEALKKRPIISMICCSLVPLAFKAMDVEAIIQCSRAGVPLTAIPLPHMGSTSPVTIAGTVLQNGIEVLWGIVLSQLVSPGAPVIGQQNFYTMDMRTGRSLCGNVESHLGAAACAQFIKDAFHIPTYTWGIGTDTYMPDGQSAFEKAVGMLLVSGVGCDILSGVGNIEGNKACSPVQAIADNDMVKIIKRAISGVKVDDDTLAWQEILDTVPAGHYLERDHTFRHCHDFLQTELFTLKTREAWNSEGRKELYARALDKYRSLKSRLKPLELPKEVQEGLNRIVKQADERMVK